MKTLAHERSLISRGVVLVACLLAAGCSEPSGPAAMDMPPAPDDMAMGQRDDMVQPDDMAGGCASGCRAGDGTCQGGDTEAACGGGGNACSVCTLGKVCRSGACVCAGCLDGMGACQPGTNDSQCGSGGNACVSCTGGQVCDNGACAAPLACNTANCPNGCCNAAGTCITGTADAACGTGGTMCSDCAAAGQSCKSQRCESACGPGTTVGCCDGTGAAQPSTNATCGINGAACVACAAGTEECINGACVVKACQMSCAGCCVGDVCHAGTADTQCGKASGGTAAACESCGPGRKCTNNACTLDLQSTWDLVLVSAAYPLKDAVTSQFWDSNGGNPDPYVNWYLDYGLRTQMLKVSTVKMNTFGPYWNEVMFRDVKAEVLLRQQRMSFWDDDTGLDPDDLVCPHEFTIQASQIFHNSTVQIVCNDRGNQVVATFKILKN
jgi:hypothetical protein